MIAAAEKPSAVLIVNPTSGRLPQSRRSEAVSILKAGLDLDVHVTRARDTGTEIAEKAVADGHDTIIAFGGDGHVNEVANGVARTAASLSILPGGTMNVFARALEIPLDPVAAARRIVERMSTPSRTVPLGRMDDRYFCFSAGCGFDAEAAERVERDLPNKRRFGEVFFYWSAFRVLLGSYRHRNPTMVLRGPFGEIPVAMAIASNSGPYAFLLGRAIDVAPDVRLDGGIDVFALHRMRIESLPAYAWRSAFSRDLAHHRDAFYASDLEAFELVSESEFHRHVDGEPLPPATSARFSVVPDALKVRV